MNKPPLNLEEWTLIHRMNSEGYEIQQIARKINRPKITVERALARFNPPAYIRRRDWLEFGKYCHEKSKERRSKSRKKLRLKNEKIKDFVKKKLENKWSPTIISERIAMELPGCSISAEAIYDWIAHESPEYERYLVRGKYKKKQGKPGSRKKKRRPKCKEKSTIDNRPESSNNRTSDGAYEADLMIGTGKSCLLTLINRKTRKFYIRKVKSKDSLAVFWALAGIFKTIPEEERLTLTLDNGTEFAKWVDLEEVFGVWVYFCHAYCSFEKGSVENRNGVVRNRFFPKGTNFDDVSSEQIQEAENWINNYPMKILNGLTPLEAEARNRKHRIELKKVG